MWEGCHWGWQWLSAIAIAALETRHAITQLRQHWHTIMDKWLRSFLMPLARWQAVRYPPPGHQRRRESSAAAVTCDTQ